MRKIHMFRGNEFNGSKVALLCALLHPSSSVCLEIRIASVECVYCDAYLIINSNTINN